MDNRSIKVIFLVLLFCTIRNVSAVTHLDDNFESYIDNAALAAKWDMVYWGGNNVDNPSEISMSRSLNTSGGVDGSKGMRMEITAEAGVSPTENLGANWEPCIYGITGYYTPGVNRTNLTNYLGIRLWIKPGTISGDQAYFKLNLIESNNLGEEKWMSPKVELDTLDVNGQYIYFDFNDFYEYYTGSGEPMDRSSIKISFLFLSYDSLTSQNSSASIWVDDIVVIGSSGGEAVFVRQPYLQNVTQNSVDVMWGSTDTTGILYWGSSPGSYTDSTTSTHFTDNAGEQVHVATITGLTINETVYYYVKNSVDSIGWNDAGYYATSAPGDDASFRFIAYGDSRPNYGGNPILGPHASIVAAMIPQDPKLILHTGDIAREGYVWEFNDFYFAPTAELAKNTPVFTTLGNHELPYYDDFSLRDYETDVKNYRDFYSLPSNNSEGIEDYYSFDYGSVRFVCLNTEWVKQGTGYYDPDRAAVMKTWLESDLASTTKPWKVVFFHKQAYVDFVEDEGWDPIFEANGVNLVLYGHGHSYLAHYKNGITYITTGGGGSPLHPPGWWAWPDYIINGFSDYHYLRIDVTPNTLFVKAYTDEDVLRHWIEINADGTIAYPTNSVVSHLDDNFENFPDNTALAAKWDMVYWGGNNEDNPSEISMSRSLNMSEGVDGSKGMQMGITVEAGISPTENLGANWEPCIYGITGYYTIFNERTDFRGYQGISIWVKPVSITGDQDVNFKLNLIESSTIGEEKWMSPKIYLADVNPNGEYIYIDFDDFYEYYTGSGESMDLSNIKISFLFLAYDYTTSQNSSATILVDEYQVVPTHLHDNFQNYPDDVGLFAKWNEGPWTWNGANVSLGLDSTGGVKNSKAMRMNISYSAGSDSPGGVIGYYTNLDDRTDLTEYAGINLWIKPLSLTGDEPYFSLRLLESATTGEEKWRSSAVILSDLDSAGQYIYFDFDDFTEYNTGSGEPMERTSIKINFLGLDYDGVSNNGGSASILVDNIAVFDQSPTVSINSQTTTLPGKITLYQNYPNPFNPITIIRYDLPKAGNVQLTIYDIIGREIVKLVNKKMDAGSQSVLWDGKDSFGQDVATGVYFCQLKVDNFTGTDKLLLIR